MTEFMVQLASMSEVKRFVNIASRQSFDIAIVSDRYSVDAKSIMGIIVLNFITRGTGFEGQIENAANHEGPVFLFPCFVIQ